MTAERLIVPVDYKSVLGIRDTEKAIKLIKDYFEDRLAAALNLTRVSAPLFVFRHTGLNDDLNGFERPVSFDAKGINGERIEIVHSLANGNGWPCTGTGSGMVKACILI